ncbi:hypothetical protein CapIbe_022770 [Capra ibex]
MESQDLKRGYVPGWTAHIKGKTIVVVLHHQSLLSKIWILSFWERWSPWVKVLLLTRLMHQRKNMALATDSSYLFQLKIIFPSRSELL